MQDECNRKDCMTGRRYQLRRAAGLYWLIDMEPADDRYVSPVPLNEGGAEIWRMIEKGMPLTDICGRLSDVFDISPEQAQEDVQDFVEQLRSKHIDFGGFE